MSSPISNSLPAQGSIPPATNPEFLNTRPGPSTGPGSVKSSRSIRDQLNSSARGRSVKAGRGRKGRQDRALVRSGEQLLKHDAAPNIDNLANQSAETGLATTSIAMSSGRVMGYRPTGHKPVKHRQRIQAGQMLEGIENLGELDIDLAESILPTNSASSSLDINKSRHSTNSRKVNLTHLLNNKFERGRRNSRSRPAALENHPSSYVRQSNAQYRVSGSLAHKFSKQQFLQANCQFVVLDGYDYSIHKADPDWPVEWDCIEEIGFKQIASTQTTCPICLEPPVAAKITRCGHIYCWTCMLHYLSLSDEKCRQCPICFEFVYERDLRSVVSHSYENFTVEDEIELTLMIRRKGCVEVEPFNKKEQEQAPEKPPPFPTSQVSHYNSRANLVILDPLTVISRIAQRERDELLVKLAIDRDEPEVCFIEQAIDRLQARVTQLHQKLEKGCPSSHLLQDNSNLVSDESSTTKTYLFYQCSDGQHIYINPFSTKILCQEYSSLENCPLRIRAKILQMDWLSMNETWRKRFRYLEHLPLTCEFRLIEIDFERPSLISRETYELFKDQIKSREQQRQLRRKEERKREKIIQVEQNRAIYGIQPALKINLDNIDQFPSVSDERYLGFTGTRVQSRASDYETSDEDESKPIATQEPSPELAQPESANSAMSEPPLNGDKSPVPSSDLVLSFKDIQIEEEAMASKAKIHSSSAQSVWSGSKASSSNQSSFAQLLVNAKTSQKEWTRTVNSAASQRVTLKPECSAGQVSKSESEACDEELRAPPFEFNIGDFIDLSSSSRKKGKLKGTGKKR